MGNDVDEGKELYNLDGGQRHTVVRGGVLKAVAPGLRLVPATEEEKLEKKKDEPPPEPKEYGLPV